MNMLEQRSPKDSIQGKKTKTNQQHQTAANQTASSLIAKRKEIYRALFAHSTSGGALYFHYAEVLPAWVQGLSFPGRGR